MAFSTNRLETYSAKENIKVIERWFDLPLDYSNPSGEKIRVFARNMIPKDKVKTEEQESALPYRGPGMESSFSTTGFAAEIHEKGYQTLWLDQRGTGLSTPLSQETLPAHLKTDKEKADYFKFFRADSIVQDCEAIRKTLIGDKPNPEDQKWTILGQSFGGFCAITYLSFYSHGLKEVFITGGLAPLHDHPDPSYEATVRRVVKRNQVYYQKYPQDIKRVRDIVAFLSTNEVVLPSSGRLSVTRWQALGIDFGMDGGIDRVHRLVLRATNDLELFNKLTFKTMQLIESVHAFDGNPLYAILHEPLYCQRKAAKWAAHRVLQKHSELFSWAHVKDLADTQPIYFTGEMVLPEMFDDFVNLRPLKGPAEILASDDTWGPLYDLDQLAKNEVNVSAVSYFDDMYVDFELAQETASKIKNTEQYVTNQMVHSGLRVDPKEVMKRLFQMSRREYD
ncbi:alpha/beta-hydrolase [Mycena floridula]|nr:alpha/beta-hydrolase [Mycena floridula]